MTINNIERANEGIYYNPNEMGNDEEDISNYSESDLDESDELLSVDSSNSSTTCFSEYIVPMVSERDIISTYISLSYLSPFAENNLYKTCCITFMEDSKVLIIEPIMKSQIGFLSNQIQTGNVTLLNFDPSLQYKEDQIVFYTQKDLRYIFSLSNFVLIINDDLEIVNENQRSIFERNNKNNKNVTVPTIIRFYIAVNSMKYKKWFNIFLKNTESRNNKQKGNESEVELLSPNSYLETDNYESQSSTIPYNYFDANVDSEFDPILRNMSPFNYSKYQPIHISIDDNELNGKINNNLPTQKYNGEKPYNNVQYVNEELCPPIINNELTEVSLEPVMRDSSPNPDINVNYNSKDELNQNLTINTNLINRNKNGKDDKKDIYRTYPKFVGKDSPRSFAAGSNISSQVDTRTINYEGDIITPISNNMSNDISFTTTHDSLEPLINHDGDYINKHNILTHRRKLTKSSSNSYLLKPDNTEFVSDENHKLLPKH
eukprot:jgi/Orpsp1_1/1177936/evm.model.c7180000063407.2